jgi:hypothetical protein
LHKKIDDFLFQCVVLLALQSQLLVVKLQMISGSAPG